MRTAQDDIKRKSFVGGVARAMGTVSLWIRRAKNGHCRCSKSDGEMQRPRVTTDDADRSAKKGHELSERPIVSDRVRFSTGRLDR